ncbi:SPOR domain-containing protein [uncultured Tateyamaria sp.]|uniref:SPOR domain-containing protein n=1 Tax=uncultured Tateyamaria sp. TaxID=455651 RepID=UPI00262874E1|nr:SPOR domain-containing protein [uncultured Tateyamaria sp.]
MKVTRIAAWAVIAASLSIGFGHAQSLRNAQAPAEFPPASFKGTQYVDSQGCVFVRAGIDGNVTWVPRVNRQRQLICGQTPSLSSAAAAAARVTPNQSARTAPEQITIAPSASGTVTAVQPTPAPRPTVRTTQAAPAAPAQPTRRVIVRRSVPAATTPQQAAKPTAAPTRAQVPAAQRTVPSVAQARVAPTTTVRRVPVASINNSAQPKAVDPETRVVPLHVYDNRIAQRPAPIPEGYQPVWEDDRLNRRRAEQSLNGIAQTRLAWTRTVPRRLIDRRTGRDVTATVPLVYPYVDVATQERDLGTVTLVKRDGQLMKRVQRKTRKKARQPVISTRSAEKPVVKTAARAVPKASTQVFKSRYVQVGTYGVPANAKAAAQRIARSGLPARIGKLKRGGKSYQVVLAGPFGSSADLSNGLTRSRALGFSDAFVRK